MVGSLHARRTQLYHAPVDVIDIDLHGILYFCTKTRKPKNVIALRVVVHMIGILSFLSRLFCGIFGECLRLINLKAKFLRLTNLKAQISQINFSPGEKFGGTAFSPVEVIICMEVAGPNWRALFTYCFAGLGTKIR